MCSKNLLLVETRGNLEIPPFPASSAHYALVSFRSGEALLKWGAGPFVRGCMAGLQLFTTNRQPGGRSFELRSGLSVSAGALIPCPANSSFGQEVYYGLILIMKTAFCFSMSD